jgi:hypothetical protein
MHPEIPDQVQHREIEGESGMPHGEEHSCREQGQIGKDEKDHDPDQDKHRIDARAEGVHGEDPAKTSKDDEGCGRRVNRIDEDPEAEDDEWMQHRCQMQATIDPREKPKNGERRHAKEKAFRHPQGETSKDSKHDPNEKPRKPRTWSIERSSTDAADPVRAIQIGCIQASAMHIGNRPGTPTGTKQGVWGILLQTNPALH